jgi:hypothetical protein
MPPVKRIGVEKRIVLEISLGQRGSKNLMGPDQSIGCSKISLKISINFIHRARESY